MLIEILTLAAMLITDPAAAVPAITTTAAVTTTATTTTRITTVATTTTTPPTTTTTTPPPTTTPATTTMPATTAAPSADNTAPADMLPLINELRSGVGASPLTIDANLTSIADIRAKEIAQDFSHTRPNGTSCFTTFADIGVSRDNYGSVGENIAAGTTRIYETVDSPFKSWVNSSGHYKNMVSTDFTLIGIGKYTDPVSGMTYWVQFFAGDR